MLQRIQTIYLLLVVLLAAGYYIFPFSTKIFPSDDPAGSADLIYKLTIQGVERSEGGPFMLVRAGWLLSVLCLLSAAIPLAAIFQFRKRRVQSRWCWAAVLCCLAVVITDYFMTDRMAGDVEPARQAVYLHASYVPLLQFLFLRLAIHRIRKDEELVRSADRIR